MEGTCSNVCSKYLFANEDQNLGDTITCSFGPVDGLLQPGDCRTRECLEQYYAVIATLDSTILQTGSNPVKQERKYYNAKKMSLLRHLTDSLYRVANVTAAAGLWAAYDNDVLTDYHDYLMSLDSVGNPQQFFVNPFTGRTRDLKLHPNGNLVYLSEERNPPMFERGGVRIQMLTPGLDTLWSYLFNDFEFPNILIEGAEAHNISIHPDGRILVSGSGAPKGMHLLCFSPERALQWVREVVVDKPEPFFYQQRINHAVWTADGHILIDGYIYGQDTAQNYISKLFLLKVDSVGCLEPGCESTNILPASEAAPENKDCWRVSPDPTGRVFTIGYGGNCQPGDRIDRLELFDNRGRCVKKYQVGKYFPFELDLENLPAGIYYVCGGEGRRTVFAKKIVIAQ